MKTAEDLQKLLRMIDHKSYPAYKDTKGKYSFGRFVLEIEHVQGDPFASPSRLSVSVEGRQAKFPDMLYDVPYKRIALQDTLTRLFGRKVQKYNFKAKGSGKSGLISVSICGQEILERTACKIGSGDGSILVRFEVGFPANGRTINARELEKILFDFLPVCVTETLFYESLDAKRLEKIAFLAEDQHYIRTRLPELGLKAFVADGAVLPRESGVSSRPMKEGIAFTSPESMRVHMELPHHGPITGMGIREGITLIVGGGYHGKSTLLKALELGVYNHIEGDGREFVITDETALKIRAEDGRSIKKTDISMFVNHLPNKKDTVAFYTEDASGSTSQAAGVIEGIESGTGLFLIDEDTCATNFMIRDELMQRVVHKDKEPITPYIERARLLAEQYGISAVIVAGSSGSYFHIADSIIQMDQYVPKDITDFAKKEAMAFPASKAGDLPKQPSFERKPLPDMELKRDNRLKIKSGRDSVSINRETIDLRYLEQIADTEQTTAIGYFLVYAQKNLLDGKKDLRTIIDQLFSLAEKKGLEALNTGSYLGTGLAMPRKQEVFSGFNRYRKLNL